MTLNFVRVWEPEPPEGEDPVEWRLVKRGKLKAQLSRQPTVREALLAIAALGGHLEHDGPPGWIVLGRGFDKLLNAEVGWWLAVEELG